MNVKTVEYSFKGNSLARKSLVVRIPMDFNYWDDELKSLIFETWRKTQNVPNIFAELQVPIEKLKMCITYSIYKEPFLIKNKKGTFLEIIFPSVKERPNDVDKILKEAFSAFKIQQQPQQQQQC